MRLLLSLFVLLPLLGCDDAAEDARPLECTGGGICDLECPATGPCAVDVASGAQATVRCNDGPCTVTCADDAQCAVACDSGQCDVMCTDSRRCSQRCATGDCTLTCEGVGACNQNCTGDGACMCSGC